MGDFTLVHLVAAINLLLATGWDIRIVKISREQNTETE